MYRPSRICGRRKNCLSLAITPGTVPDFTIPVGRDFKGSESGITDTCSDESTQPAALQVGSHWKIRSQSPLKNRSRTRGDSYRAGQSSYSLLSNVSVGSSSADSALPPSPRSHRRLSGDIIGGPSRRFSANMPTAQQPRSFSLNDERVTPIGVFGFLTRRAKDVFLSLYRFQSPLDRENVRSPGLLNDNAGHRHYNVGSTAGFSSSMLRAESANRIISKSKRPLTNSDSMSDTSTVFRCHRDYMSSQLTIADEEPDDQVEIATKEADPANSIVISVVYKTHEQRLVVQVNSLTCVDPRGDCTRDLVVELTLNPGKQRHAVSVTPEPLADTLPKRVVFKKVSSFSLASRSLSVKVYTKRLIRKTGQILYQTSMPLNEASLMRDAKLLSLNPADKKAKSFVSICMCYLVHKGKLVVTVINAKGLKKSAIRKGSYVEVKLLRGCGEKAKIQTVRTKSHSGGQNPVYREKFSLELPPTGLVSCYTELTFTVRRWNLARADEVLGRVTLSSEMLLRWKKTQSLENTLDEVFRHPGKVITQSHRLN